VKDLKFEHTLDQRVFITSDTHYGHGNIIRYCKRPWLSPREKQLVEEGVDFRVSPTTLKDHDDALIKNINDEVRPQDILINLGDVAWGFAALKEFKERVNCTNIYTIIGNHDHEDDLVYCFGRSRVYERVVISVTSTQGTQDAVLDHYPGDSWHASHHGTWQLFGHVHGLFDEHRSKNPAHALSLDVGVDTHEYRPWNWGELLIHFAAKKPQWLEWKRQMKSKDKGGMAAPKAS
jgi:calcineurin-like phosphoesterase family protein